MFFNKLKKNEESRKLINRYKTIITKIIKTKASITFLIRCRNQGIIPNFIKNSTKNIFTIFHVHGPPPIHHIINNYIQAFNNKILNLAIKQQHLVLKKEERELLFIKNDLKSYLNYLELKKYIQIEDKLSRKFAERIKQVHKRKFDYLIELQRKELGIKFNKNWFINKTKENIPEDVQYILSLGQKHALPIEKEQIPVINMIADGEDIIQSIQDRENQETSRSYFTTMLDSCLNKTKLTNIDKFFINKVHFTEKYLKSKKNIMILRADKGNTTVALDKLDYEEKINNIVNDNSTYQLSNKDPTNKLQRINNDIVERLFKNKTVSSLEKKK